MIHVKCYHKDKRSDEWPDEMACRPLVGDFITTMDGRLRAEITLVTHRRDADTNKGKPYLEVQLS